MSVPAGPTIATATLQLFFAASASAGAAAFLAFSRLMAVPYGFGICATALASAPNATITAATNLTLTFCDMFSPPQVQATTAFAKQRNLARCEFHVHCFRSLALRRANKIARVIRIARALVLRNLRIGTERPRHLHARGRVSALVFRRDDRLRRSPPFHPLFERQLHIVLRIPCVPRSLSEGICSRTTAAVLHPRHHI